MCRCFNLKVQMESVETSVSTFSTKPEPPFCLPSADFGFARYLQNNMMAATLCGSPMYMVNTFTSVVNVLQCSHSEPNVLEGFYEREMS